LAFSWHLKLLNKKRFSLEKHRMTAVKQDPAAAFSDPTPASAPDETGGLGLLDFVSPLCYGFNTFPLGRTGIAWNIALRRLPRNSACAFRPAYCRAYSYKAGVSARF
jgi:hypothetical protein